MLPRIPGPALAVMAACSVMLLGLSSIQAVWTELLLQRACVRLQLPYPSVACDHGGQEEATLRATWMNLAMTIPAMLTVGTVSSVADSRGRRPAMLLTFISPLVFCLAVLLVPGSFEVSGTHIDGYWVILVVSCLFSFTGGNSATFSTAMSVIADISDGWEASARTALFMALEAAMWGGAIAGPTLGGKIAKIWGMSSAFLFAAAVIAVSMGLLLLFSTETLKEKRAFAW